MVAQRIALALLSMLAVPLAAQQHEITPFIGWQAGGAVFLEDENTSLDGAAVFGAMLTFDRGQGRKLDIVAAHQNTVAERSEPFEPPISADVTVDYLHIGGRYHFHPQDRFDPYVAVTIGGTRISVRNASGVAFSAAYGLGTDVRVTRAFTLRLDGRFYTTLGGGQTEVSCSGAGNCSGFASGASLTQFAATTGVVFKF